MYKLLHSYQNTHRTEYQLLLFLGKGSVVYRGEREQTRSALNKYLGIHLPSSLDHEKTTFSWQFGEGGRGKSVMVVSRPCNVVVDGAIKPRIRVSLLHDTRSRERGGERERWSMDWLWGISLRFDFRIKSIHFFSTDRGVSTTSQSRTQARETLLIHKTLTLFSFYIPEYQHMSSTPFAGSPARSQCRTPSRDR